MTTTLRAARMVACVAAALCLSGCETAPKDEPVRSVRAAYSYPALSAILPEGNRVPAIIAAAEDTLRSRGYSIASSHSTEESGKIVARPPRTSDYPELTVRSSRLPEGARVEVRVTPFGDKDLSRSVLDGTLQRLGL